MKRRDTYSLNEIASWPETKEVVLPNVQRGFVWKPSQIENLWDSLLRCYPVGAFVLTPNKIDKDKFEMLDGQQRATAICLGFAKQTFRKTKYRVFIDLDKPAPSDNREYVFRVITPSHPWGYQWTDNTKTLTADNKRKAMESYRLKCGVSDPFQESAMEMLFPFDASLPVPFEIFIEAAKDRKTEESVVTEILKWLQTNSILNDWLDEIKKIKTDLNENPKSKKKLPELNSLDLIKIRIVEIFHQTAKIFDTENGQRIPALYLNIDDIDRRKDHSINKTNPTSKDDIEIQTSGDDLEENDPIENLFIRLNDGGTPLRGEELNYSILKANIEEELQIEIENACKGFIKPSRFISIAFRLFQHQNKYEGSDGLSLKIKPKQFQRAINEKKNKVAFLLFLSSLLKANTIYEGKTLLQYARERLEFNKDNCTYGFPYLIVCNLADKAPEIMFLYLFRLMKKTDYPGDKFTLDTDAHRKMLGVLSILVWLGRSEKQRNYNQTLRYIWPAAETLETELFWSSITIQRAMLNDSFNKPPTIKDLYKLKKLFTTNIRRDTDIKEKRLAQSGFYAFIENMLTYKNRDLILYAQRGFLDKAFTKEHYFFDDTDMPFDWDHISPNSLVHGLQDISPVLKQWYNSNGNFRAWPYALNRMDQDNTPAFKLNPLNPNIYNDDESWKLDKAKESWQQFTNENKHLGSSLVTLSKDLIEWSVCDNEWANCNAGNLKMKDNWNQVYLLIIKRNFKLLKIWHSELLIQQLIPSKQTDRFSSLLNLSQWKDSFKVNSDKQLTKYLKETMPYETSKIWVSKALNISDTSFHFFIAYDKSADKMIKNNDIVFGILASPNNAENTLFRIPEQNKVKYNSDNKSFVEGYFTLASHEHTSYYNLINDLSNWLGKHPSKKIASNLQAAFLKIIKTSYKLKV